MKQKILIFIFLEGMCFSQDGSLIGIKKKFQKNPSHKFSRWCWISVGTYW